MKDIESIATQIVDAAVKVHKALGPGLLESAYQACLAYELRNRSLRVECELIQPIEYNGLQIDAGYRVDMLVEDCIIIENKCMEKILPIHMAQILTYLKLRDCQLGFIINWHAPLIKDGIKRVVNKL
jgi:GxxExxY protein